MIVRAALTQTVNAYPKMPGSREGLLALRDRLPEIARANVDHHLGLLGEAAKRGVQLVCFGELFPAPYFALEANPLWHGLAEDAERGETISRVCEGARRHRLVVVAPIYEREPGGRRFNTAVVVDEDGEILGKYRKAHIPNGANEQGSFHEGFYYERSDGQLGRSRANVSRNDFFPVFQTSVGRLGVAICYDRHFEGVVSTLAREGAELVLSPAVTFGEKSQRMWRQEFQVDAARHGVFIGGSNRKGMEPPWNQPYFGDSHFVGPNGPLPDRSDHEQLAIGDLDLGLLGAPDPAGWQLRRDARPDIYGGRSSG
ncbi:MAG: nitrilase-related carbon-nitrogen hydrolase [Deltaproteobacteria bacterium]